VPYPKPYEPLSAAASRFLWPRAAADFLVEEDLPDAVFNNFNSGNYLNWAIFPRRIFINGTLTHRKTEEVYAWIRQRPEQWDRLAGEWGIETVFIRLTPIIAPSALLQQIVNHPGWKLVFYDGTAAVLVRDDPEHPDTRAIPAVDLGKELQSSVREILSNASRVPGSSLPLWGEIVQYTWRQDLARLFRLRGQFYLLAGRPDLAATAAEMVRNLEG
jgi:hypothetical protein